LLLEMVLRDQQNRLHREVIRAEGGLARVGVTGVAYFASFITPPSKSESLIAAVPVACTMPD